MSERNAANTLVDELTSKIIEAHNKFAEHRNMLEARHREDLNRAYDELQEAIRPMMREREIVIKRLTDIEAVKSPAQIIVGKGE